LLQRQSSISPTPISPPKPAPQARPDSPSRAIAAIVIAASTGGPKALEICLPELSRRVKQPIFIVQHMPAPFTLSLAENLDRLCSRPVREAVHGQVVDPNGIYIAPGGYHLLLRREGNTVILALNQHPPENGSRPAADVLFRSAASVYEGHVIGIVLTGMLTDGTRGAGTLKRAGAMIIAQDEASSIVWGMPGSVVKAGLADAVVPITEVAACCARLAGEPGGR